MVSGLFLHSSSIPDQKAKRTKQTKAISYKPLVFFLSLTPLGLKTSHELKYKVYLTTSTCSSPEESFLFIGWTFIQTGKPLETCRMSFSTLQFIFNVHWCRGSLFPEVSIKRNKIILGFSTQTCLKALLSKCRCVWHIHVKLKPVAWLHKGTGCLPLNRSRSDCWSTMSFGIESRRTKVFQNTLSLVPLFGQTVVTVAPSHNLWFNQEVNCRNL